MRLLIKQRLFSWFDSYDIYDEVNRPVYTVKGQPAWGHCFKIFGVNGEELGTVKEKLFSFRPKFELYVGNAYVGCIKKEFVFFKHKFSIDFNGWQIDGNLLGWDYTVRDRFGRCIATVSKELAFTDTYVIDVADSANALCVLMLVLAIDADKCNNND